MYESPIDVFITRMNVERNRVVEKEILTAVQGVGVHVNKHELEKALLYDRGQYKKGYADGVKEFAEAFKKEYFLNGTIHITSISDSCIDDLVEQFITGKGRC